jgi:hypothetical protein
MQDEVRAAFIAMLTEDSRTRALGRRIAKGHYRLNSHRVLPAGVRSASTALRDLRAWELCLPRRTFLEDWH